MLTYRTEGKRLTIWYRPGVLGVVGAILAVLGVVIVGFALLMHHTVTLTCDGERGRTCVVERTAVLGSERTHIKNLRGVEAGQELVLRADPDLVMGRWVSRWVVASYRDAAIAIEKYLEGGESRLHVSIPDRSTLRWWGVGLLLVVLGGALLTLFAIGARATFDRAANELRYGSRRVPLSDLTSFEVRGNQVLGQLQSGTAIVVLSTLGGRKGAKPKPRPDLDAAAEQIRRFLDA